MLVFILPSLKYHLSGLRYLLWDCPEGLSDPLFDLWCIPVIMLLAGYFAPGFLKLLMRRCHDLGLSGGYAWFVLVPYVGPASVLLVGLLPSQPASNRWGPPSGWY